VQNALAIPVNVPLGLALAEFITETGIPTIAHHHDLYWERQRFHSFAAMDYLRSSFPPVQPSIQHVVINSLDGFELGRRTGVKYTMVPNIMDFTRPTPGIDDYTRDFRDEIDLDPGTLLVLQPTRLVGRKGIETAIEFVSRLGRKAALVIPHKAGDEGYEYQKRIAEYARYMGVDLRLIADRVAKRRSTLWDIYPQADLVTYPSLYEGFGNAFVEAIYFRRPVLVNRYEIYEASQTIPQRSRYLSYEMFEEKLELILTNIYGA